MEMFKTQPSKYIYYINCSKITENDIKEHKKEMPTTIQSSSSHYQKSFKFQYDDDVLTTF